MNQGDHLAYCLLAWFSSCTGAQKRLGQGCTGCLADRQISSPPLFSGRLTNSFQAHNILVMYCFNIYLQADVSDP